MATKITYKPIKINLRNQAKYLQNDLRILIENIDCWNDDEDVAYTIGKTELNHLKQIQDLINNLLAVADLDENGCAPDKYYEGGE